MNITQRKKKIVESYLDLKFKKCSITIEENIHNQSNGFYLKERHYYLCDIQVLYYYERPDSFKVAFDFDFFRELEKWVPLRGKKQIFRDWLFCDKFPDFEYKNLLMKKFSYYGEKNIT
jgi:hypothetical protein